MKRNLERHLKRTHVTTLSDDELILFDALWRWDTTYEQLRRDNIGGACNLPQHQLSDLELRTTLDHYVDIGWLEREVCQRKTFFHLTPLGGAQWEAERTPIWERYAWYVRRESRRGHPYICIVATKPQIRDELWNLGCYSGHFYFTQRTVRRFTVPDEGLLGWKQFPQLYVLIASGEHIDYVTRAFTWGKPCRNWHTYERDRTWWSGPSMLQKFLQ
jgi:hypothetical protein